jgi:hypothetical protein
MQTILLAPPRRTLYASFSSFLPRKLTRSVQKTTTQHAWIQTSQVTSSKALNHLVLEFSTGGVKSYFCGWEGCKHPVGFAQKPQLITHIRSVHLQEKPFLCTTWFVIIRSCSCSKLTATPSNTLFARKQEASRHVISLNSGRKYKCSGWFVPCYLVP